MKSASLLSLFALALCLALPAQAAPPTLPEALAADPDLSTLNRAVAASGLGETLAAAPAVTVLAPSNEAFAALPAGTLDGLLAPEGKAALEALLKRHVIGAAYDVNGLKVKRVVVSLAGHELRPELVRGKLRLDGEVRVAARAIRVANGYVLVIDRVLTP